MTTDSDTDTRQLRERKQNREDPGKKREPSSQVASPQSLALSPKIKSKNDLPSITLQAINEMNEKLTNIQASISQLCDTQAMHGTAIKDLSRQLTALQNVSVETNNNSTCETVKKKMNTTYVERQFTATQQSICQLHQKQREGGSI